ncbi:2-oxoglutarate dehydrogenase E2 component (dihydrolipoamide succinyltransferase) [Spirosoma sp. LMG 31448]|uniref:Dihydrolipoyllysine-residue succinyltransferase component of 2-oxoglutarate dehydrogenase complex n=2 Tax=Spirosoma utsteinense TaxID=2585773 RepID=A0ABR6W1P8_9BACT|nr:2-oxoglutarate dehydrogenase E2 component (dihydrolipoamide succinyltransferase) [Spirosoma utsteinense]MBC3790382.1 2-oxoglutarate dehydrogenase E2 component (dihydrolipoamide succinyltransferase) [Spirosoma utsteinense]
MKIPAVGESITEVTVGTWYKKEGDQVKMDEVLCGLDSDKATFELTAEANGTLHILAQEGDVLPIGASICTIDGDGSAAPAAPSAEPAQAPAPAQPAATNADPTPALQPVAEPAQPAPSAATKVIEMKVPAVGESVTEVTIASWSKKDGDQVALDEVLCELESDKATFELPAEAAGTLRIVAQEGETLAIGALIAKIEVGATAAAPASQPASAPAAQQPAPVETTSNGQNGYAVNHPSPAAAKILDEKGISAQQVQGTGVGGRLTKEDAMKASPAPAQPAPSAPAPAPAAAKPAAAPAPAPVMTGERAQRREKMTSLRRTIARRLVAVKNETAMLTTFNEVDMKPIMDLRNKYKDKFKEKNGVGLGFMSFFTKAVCTALKDFPAVNAQIDGDQMVFNDFCDISIAVSSDRGLVVPVIRNAEQLSFAQIEKEIVRLAGLARENKLTIEQMTGGTFTITNGGTFGSMLSTPIINAPQSAILGMHNIVERAVVVNGEIVIRPIMYVALSYDHRIIDGKESVSFLVRVKQILEDPARLLFDM